MIDWFNLGANALGLIDCAVVLATLSSASWEANLFRQKLTERLKQHSILLTLNLGAALTRGGMVVDRLEGIDRPGVLDPGRTHLKGWLMVDP